MVKYYPTIYKANKNGEILVHSSEIKQKLLTAAMFCCLSVNYCIAADTPEQTEQYKYAMGLIQHQLYEEAAKVLSNILSEPKVFSQSDGALFWLGQCEYSQKNYIKLF